MPDKHDVFGMFDDAVYLGSWDLQPAKKVFVVQIKRVKEETLTGGGGRKSRKPIVYFERTERGLALNKTNAKCIARMYGKDVRQWAGKKVGIYYDPTVKFGRDVVGGIRVQPGIPKGEPTGIASQPVDQEMRERQNAAAGRERAPHPAAPLGVASNAQELLAAIRTCAGWIEANADERWPKVLERCIALEVSENDADAALQEALEAAAS